MRSTRPLAALPLLAFLACSEMPTQPASRPERQTTEAAAVTTEAGTLVRVASDAYTLVQSHPCTSDAVLRNDTPLSGPAPNMASVINNGGGTNPCGCPATVPPPSRIPGWTCTLKTWECKPGSGVTTCMYTCTPPVANPGTGIF